MCDYPKSPESKISEIAANIDTVYKTALENYKPGDITLIGDSAGGTLIIALVQRIIRNKIEKPHKLILISPVLDASFSNPQIQAVDKTDPMLSTTGLVSAMMMCAENNDLKNEMISPLYAGFEQFPNTMLFLAENDITYPDQLLAVQKLNEANIETEIITGVEMPHVWPFLPFFNEGRTALNEIIFKINY
jgi:acetyl esterase/lipase